MEKGYFAASQLGKIHTTCGSQKLNTAHVNQRNMTVVWMTKQTDKTFQQAAAVTVLAKHHALAVW